MTDHRNLSDLQAACDDLPLEESRALVDFVIGYVAAHVDPAVWRQALDAGLRDLANQRGAA